MEPNYSGWASKANMRCTDGRKIMPGFAKKQDKTKVPLIYMHNHKDASQILGYAELTHMDEGTWTDLYFNGNQKALDTLHAIEHGDVDKLSVWAKDLEERIVGQDILVHDGVIQEVSVVLAGANPGAGLANVLMHADVDFDNDEDMAFVGFELYKSSELKELKHADDEAKKAAEKVEDPPPADKTIPEVLATLTDEQQLAVNGFIDEIVTEAVTTALTEQTDLQHDDLEKDNKMNLFDKTKPISGANALPELKHDDVVGILMQAKGSDAGNLRSFNEDKATGSLRSMVRNQIATSAKGEMLHADDYGVQNVEILFPDAQALMARPTWIDRRQEWVKKFMAGTSHSPFSRIKTMYADITADEARARGYIKGSEKVEEVFPIFKRTTGPAWIYKMQKLDRQDIIDIVDFDVVAWMKAEMRGKLDEEIARAGLFGDGRAVMVDGKMNPDKVQEPTGNSGDGIRSIMNDDDLYSTTYNVPMAVGATGTAWNVLLDTVTEAGEFYLGSGNKTAFVSYRAATKLLTIRDEFGHRMYRNLSEVAGDMDVAEIVRVPTELFPTDVLCIVVDLSDYNFGTNRGGDVTLFDDFDIKFNQYLYLIETYLSGALTTPYAAQIFKRVNPAGTNVEDVPRPPIVDNVITIPTVTGVAYRQKNADGTTTAKAGGATITLNDTNAKQVVLEATAATGYYFDSNDDRKDEFTYRYKAPAS